MKTRPKYFEILISLALLAGQVQYVRTTYFCAQLRESVGTPSVDSRSSRTSADDETCDACQGFIPSYHGQVLSRPNCIQVQTIRMNTVSSFVEANSKSFNPPMTFMVRFIPKLTDPFINASKVPVLSGASPPQNLALVNSILRI